MTDLCIERQCVLPRSAHDVYRYLQRFDTIAQWDPGVLSAERVEPNRYALQLAFFGRAVPMSYRGDHASAPSDSQPGVLRFVGEGDGFSAIDVLTITPVNNEQCQLHYRADLTLGNLPSWLSPLLNGWGKRLGDAAFGGIQAALADDGIASRGAWSRLGERLVLPGMRDYTQRGYRQLPSRGLSRFMDGKTVAITGVTSGLGLAMAEQFARLGAQLLLIGRDPQRLADVQAHLQGPRHEAVSVRCVEADVSSVRSAEQLLQHLRDELEQIDVWINNAGALFAEQALTAEGVERAMAVNFVVPAYLTQQLLAPMAKRNGRIIQMLSGGLYTQGVQLNDMAYTATEYNGPKAYARAKRALLDVSQRWASAHHQVGIHCLHPGWAATPGVEKSLPSFHARMKDKLRTPLMGADTAVWLASHPTFEFARHSGQFWFDRSPRPTALLANTASSSDTVDELLQWLAAQTQATLAG